MENNMASEETFVEESTDAVNDQLIRETQAKIDHDIASQFSLVSEPVDILRLHTEYSDEDAVYQQKVDDLASKYTCLRRTRPDGNCFYRAFIFGYFESLFTDPVEVKRFLETVQTTRKEITTALGFPDFTVDEFYEYFYEIVTMIDQGKIRSSAELMEEMDKPAVSDNIVVYLRLLTSYYLQKQAEFFVHFIEGGIQIGDFCKCEVEPMYKESDHIHITALSAVLEVSVRVVYMDRGAGGKVNEHDFTGLFGSVETNGQEPRIHLLYRPGHYDILYRKQH